jgi:hypothetical protein
MCCVFKMQKNNKHSLLPLIFREGFLRFVLVLILLACFGTLLYPVLYDNSEEVKSLTSGFVSVVIFSLTFNIYLFVSKCTSVCFSAPLLSSTAFQLCVDASSSLLMMIFSLLTFQTKKCENWYSSTENHCSFYRCIVIFGLSSCAISLFLVGKKLLTESQSDEEVHIGEYQMMDEEDVINEKNDSVTNLSKNVPSSFHMIKEKFEERSEAINIKQKRERVASADYLKGVSKPIRH